MLVKMNEVGSNSKDSALSSELEDVIINLTSPSEDKFLPYKFKLPRASTKHYPRKKRYLFQYKMAKPLIVDTTNTDTWHSPNASSDCYCISYKSLRMLSRSGKIMNALSSAHSSFRQDTVGIRKSLNFDSSPSPKGSSSYDENSTSSINTDTSSSLLNLSSVDSTDSIVPMTSVESIDENQNQTPQQNRKSSYRTDIKDNMHIRSRTFYLMSLVEGQKEATNKNANHGSSHPFRSFKPFTGSKGPSRVTTASTPRNLFQEFNQELDDRPRTPENVINVIPESISAIKKSHKKEKLCFYEEQSSIQQMDVSVKNNDLHSRTSMESPEIDMIATSSCYGAFENESQKKNKNIKRTLIYNDEHNCNTESDSDHSVQQKTASTKNDSLESGLDQIESDKMQDIDSIDESYEDMQVNVCLINHSNKEEDRSNENVCNEEVSQLLLQNESSGICNVMGENRMASPESSSNISQNVNKVITPENNINMLKHVLTESIKKSHKKIKHGNRKMLFKTPIKDPHQKMGLTKSEILLEGVCNIDQDIESQTPDAIHVSSPQNSELDRPSTPENVNSSRLLLLDFNSVKKSHKKDKRSKRTSSFVEYNDNEYYKKGNNSLRRKYEEKICRTLRKNKSLGLKDSPGISPKKESVSTFLQSSTPKFPNAFVSLGCKDINDEFKIFTPIKKRRIPVDIMNYVSSADTSQEDEFAQATSKEIDCSRCVTPVTRCFKLRKHEDLASERDNAKRSETDVTVLKVADTVNSKDKNGRSTPINMSTTELLCNIDSIKKSHKKDKYNRSKRLILKKKRSYIEKSEHVNFGNNNKLEEPTNLSLKHHIDKNCAEKEMYIIMREKEKNKSYKEIAYDDPDDPQPSTSRGTDNMENVKNISKSKFLDTTPPNSLSAMNLMKLVQTTSIKKSHKKERDINAQTKYILMSQEHELSDDGSIFDEEERLNFIQNDSIAQDDI